MFISQYCCSTISMCTWHSITFVCMYFIFPPVCRGYGIGEKGHKNLHIPGRCPFHDLR